jgi:hypothetical protein
MAQVFGADFAPYLQQCVPALVASCQQNESADELLEDGEGGSTTTANLAEAFAAGSSKLDDDEEDIEDETDLDALEAMFSKVNSAVAIEKEVAADTIGELFAATKAAFVPYIEETVQVLIDLLDHYYEGIRKSAVGALFSCIKTIYELSNPQDWVPGGVVVSGSTMPRRRRSVLTPSQQVPFHADVKKLVGHILPRIFEAWATEDDKWVFRVLDTPVPPYPSV